VYLTLKFVALISALILNLGTTGSQAASNIDCTVRSGVVSSSNLLQDSSEQSAMCIATSVTLDWIPASLLRLHGYGLANTYESGSDYTNMLAGVSAWVLPSPSKARTRFDLGASYGRRFHRRSQKQFERIDFGVTVGCSRTLSQRAIGRVALVANVQRYPYASYADQFMFQSVVGLNLTLAHQNVIDLSFYGGILTCRALDIESAIIGPINPTASLTNMAFGHWGATVRWSRPIGKRTGFSLEAVGKSLSYDRMRAIMGNYTGYLTPWEWETWRVGGTARVKTFIIPGVITHASASIEHVWYDWASDFLSSRPLLLTMREDMVAIATLGIDVPIRINQAILGTITLGTRYRYNSSSEELYDFNESGFNAQIALSF
jgi:hypothetical protein